MMGSQRGADPMMGLLALASNPTMVHEHLSKLQAATEAHQKAKAEARAAQAETERVAATAHEQLHALSTQMQAVLSGRAENVAERDDLTAAKKALEQAIGNDKRALELAQQEHQARVSNELAQLQAARTGHESVVQAHKLAVSKAEAELLQREQGITAREGRLARQEALAKEREDKLNLAEADLTQRINKMRSLAAG